MPGRGAFASAWSRLAVRILLVLLLLLLPFTLSVIPPGSEAMLQISRRKVPSKGIASEESGASDAVWFRCTFK